jgi:hypothetical protein
MNRAMGDELAAALVFRLVDMCAAAGRVAELSASAVALAGGAQEVLLSRSTTSSGADHAVRIAERFVFPINGQNRNQKVGKPWSKIAGRAV